MRCIAEDTEVSSTAERDFVLLIPVAEAELDAELFSRLIERHRVGFCQPIGYRHGSRIEPANGIQLQISLFVKLV